MKDGSDQDWKAAWKGLPKPSASACPPTETLSAFVADTLDGAHRDTLLEHLITCPACREDVAAARAQQDSTAPAALRLRLYRLMPGRTAILPRLAIAAAAVVAIAIGAIVFWPSKQEAVKPIVSKPERVQPQPMPKEKPPTPEPRPEVLPPTPEPSRPSPNPEVPPTRLPDRVKPPAGVPDPKPTPMPAPPSEKPAPAPEKPAPEPTRVALKGTLLNIAGSCSSQLEGEATAQALRMGQKRDFAGLLKLKADVAASKVTIGTVTYYLQRGGELSLLLEEGRTKVQLVKGEAFFDVTPGQGQFLVETASGRITVKGTRFLVSAEKAETEVLLQKGAIEFSAADQTVTLAPGERSAAPNGRAPGAAQKTDVSKRLGWVRALEDSILIHADQMALQGGMVILPDPSADGGRAIGTKAPLKAGQDASAEIPARRKQAVPYSVWIRLHWGHGVPSSLGLSVGDTLTWSAKGVVASPNWQWIRVGTTELEERFRVRLTDTQHGARVDQILITSDPELNPENK